MVAVVTIILSHFVQRRAGVFVQRAGSNTQKHLTVGKCKRGTITVQGTGCPGIKTRNLRTRRPAFSGGSTSSTHGDGEFGASNYHSVPTFC